ncbi:MAG: efflux RND transporter periplasmic adaptor subunit [bacterium]
MGENTGKPTDRNSGKGAGIVKTIFICLFLIAGGASTIWYIFYSQPEPRRGDRPEPSPVLVDTKNVDTGTFRPTIEAMGTVRPTQEIVLRPRVSGEVVQRADNFVPGGFVRKGTKLLQINKEDYITTLRQRQASVRQARSDLRLEMGRQEVARQEYKLLGDTLAGKNRELILRKPQLESARASLESARASLEQARLDLTRTSVEAPFDAHVLSRNVNVGSQVSAGENLARLVGVDQYWVEANVARDKLPYINIPDTPEELGSMARVRNHTSWEPDQYRQGYVSRMIGELGSEARMVRLLVTVRDPLNRNDTDSRKPSLMVGSYVRTELTGKPIRNVTRIERKYLREDNTVWLKKDGKLEVVDVRVVFQGPKYAYVRGDIESSDQMVTSSLSSVIEGMELRERENNKVSSDTDTRDSEHSDGESYNNG